MHDETHFSLFYAEYGVPLQKRFLGHFLKDEDTGWDKQPRVHLRTRHADGHIGERFSTDWPLAETRWTRLYLDAAANSMSTTPVTSNGPFLHTDPDTRPDDIYAGTVTVHTGPGHNSYLILPVIPD
jgi:predicted acyl esterase